jgi:hypothetical protein
VYTNSLHFFTFQMSAGSTNTVVWADEGLSISTNLSVPIVDVYSNQWTGGAIMEEPVIAEGYYP